MRPATCLLLCFVFLGASALGAAHRVVPDPGPGELSLQAALELARPGDEIVLEPGRYEIQSLSITKSVRISAEGEVTIKGVDHFRAVFVVKTGRVTIAGIAFTGGETGIEVSGNADLSVERCRFSDLKVGAKLEDGRGRVVDCEFVRCGTGISAAVRLEVSGCRFIANAVGIEAHPGARVRVTGCSFVDNDLGIVGRPPGSVEGEGNLFSGKGLALVGAVSPDLRPRGEGTCRVVEYPSPDYPSLQAAVDALQEGGRLLITKTFAESAVIDRPLEILPADARGLLISGYPGRKGLLPAFSLVGEVEVRIRNLTFCSGLEVGPRASLHLSDVGIFIKALSLSGNSELRWEGGTGALRLYREAKATLSGVRLVGDPGLSLEDIARATLTDCRIVSLDREEAAVVGGGARLVLNGGRVLGTLVLQDRAEVTVEGAVIGGEVGERPRYGVEFRGPAKLVLRDVEIRNSWVGIYFAAAGEVTLSGGMIHDTHVGMGIENRVSEFTILSGLWTPKIVPKVMVEGPRVELFGNDVDLAPAATQEPWPVGFYELLYSGRTPDPVTIQALAEVREAGKDITSCRLRVKKVYRWEMGESAYFEEVHYVSPDKVRIDVHDDGELTRTIVSDGHTLWDYRPYWQSATRIDLDALKESFPEGYLSVIWERARFDPTFADLYVPSASLLGVEEVDGERCYVFRGIPIRGAQSDAVAMKVWISPRDGLWRKVEYYTTKGEAFLVKTVLESELEPEIPPGTFGLQLPEGVDVRDETDVVQEKLQRL